MEKGFGIVASLLLGVSLFLLASVASAQTVHVCQKDGRKIMTDSPCDRIGAETMQIRTQDSFRPLTVITGISPRERQTLNQYKARDAVNNAQWEADRRADREAARQQEAAKNSNCARLNAEKNSIVAQLRQNSTQWLNDRHRTVNDEIGRMGCSML